MDEIKKDIVPSSDENLWDNNENLNEDSVNFSWELENLKNLIKKEVIKKTEDWEKLKINEDLDKIDKFFEQWKKEFEKVDTSDEKEIIKKYNTIRNRPVEVQKEIEKISNEVLDEIYNWKQEKNPVARSLLRIINWIMSSEK